MPTEVTVPVPDGLSEAEARRVAENALDRAATAAEVSGVLAAATVAQPPGHLAQLALREERWRGVEETWGMLSSDEVATLTGTTRGRATAANLRRRNGLAGVKRHGALRYPAFQFADTGDGTAHVAPAWTRLRELLDPTGWADADVLAWAAAPNAWLDARSPAEEIQEHPDKVGEGLEVAAAKAVPDPSDAARDV